jgi:hypothetical protein
MNNVLGKELREMSRRSMAKPPRTIHIIWSQQLKREGVRIRVTTKEKNGEDGRPTRMNHAVSSSTKLLTHPCASGCVAPETVAARNAPGGRVAGPFGLLPRRVHVPIQPAHVPPSRETVLPAGAAGGLRRSRALCVAGQACAARKAPDAAPQVKAVVPGSRNGNPGQLS